MEAWELLKDSRAPLPSLFSFFCVPCQFGVSATTCILLWKPLAFLSPFVFSLDEIHPHTGTELWVDRRVVTGVDLLSAGFLTPLYWGLETQYRRVSGVT